MLGKLKKRGYVNKEIDAVFYTKDIVQTLDGLMNILGFYEQVGIRDRNMINRKSYE